MPLLKKCGAVAGSDADCEMAYHICYNTIEFSMSSVVDMDPYDVRKEFKNPFLPKTYVAYLRRQEVVKAIRANAKIPYASALTRYSVDLPEQETVRILFGAV